MISYETAVKLEKVWVKKSKICVNEKHYETKLRHFDCYVPSLEEIIDACVPNFFSLRKTPVCWVAESDLIEETPKGSYIIVGCDKIRLIAVANLYLALNEKI